MSSQNVVSKMNKIRLLYIEANNKINDQFDNLTTIFTSKNSTITPAVSIGTRLQIQEKLKAMREIAVNSINNIFENGIHLLPYSDIHSSRYSSSRRFSRNIVEFLEQSFSQNNYPTDFEKARLAKSCNLTIKQVNNWFTNKRNRNKMYQNCNKY